MRRKQTNVFSKKIIFFYLDLPKRVKRKNFMRCIAKRCSCVDHIQKLLHAAHFVQKKASFDRMTRRMAFFFPREVASIFATNYCFFFYRTTRYVTFFKMQLSMLQTTGKSRDFCSFAICSALLPITACNNQLSFFLLIHVLLEF